MKEKTKIKGLKELFGNSFSLYKANWVNFLLVALSITVVTLFSTYLITGDFLTTSDQFDVTRLVNPLFWIGLAIVIAVVVPLSLALNKVVYQAGEGQPENFSMVVSYGFKNFLPYLWVTILVALVTIVGLILLIIPGVYVAVLLSMVAPVFVLEGLRGVAALKRSAELVKGYFWAVLGRAIVLGLGIAIVSAILFGNVPIISDIVTAALAPFSTVFIYLIYKDLKAIKTAQ